MADSDDVGDDVGDDDGSVFVESLRTLTAHLAALGGGGSKAAGGAGDSPAPSYRHQTRTNNIPSDDMARMAHGCSVLRAGPQLFRAGFASKQAAGSTASPQAPVRVRGREGGEGGWGMTGLNMREMITAAG